MYGLIEQDLQYIVDVLSKYPQIKEALIFGSRALNRYKKGSDIDVALKGHNLQTIVNDVFFQLNELSPFPYRVDIVDYNTLESQPLSGFAMWN